MTTTTKPMTKTDLTSVVLNSLTGQPMSIIDISREVFMNSGLSPADDMFYTYQYDMRWSLMELVNSGVVSRDKLGNRSFYSLSN